MVGIAGKVGSIYGGLPTGYAFQQQHYWQLPKLPYPRLYPDPSICPYPDSSPQVKLLPSPHVALNTDGFFCGLKAQSDTWQHGSATVSG